MMIIYQSSYMLETTASLEMSELIQSILEQGLPPVQVLSLHYSLRAWLYKFAAALQNIGPRDSNLVPQFLLQFRTILDVQK